jgi:signal peptidase I
LNEIIKRRRPWLAALLSFLLSGLGQLYSGRPGRGGLLFGLSALVTLIFLVPGSFDRSFYEQLPWIAILFIAGVAIRLFAIIDAWRLAQRVGALRLRWYNRWYAYSGTIVIATAIGFALPAWPYGAYSIPSASMAPTIVPGDYVLVLKYDGIPSPKPGDVAVVTRNGTDYMKRVVAVAGDRVQMIEGRLSINGTVVSRQESGELSLGDNRYKLYQETLPNGRSYEIAEISDKEFLDNTAEFIVPSHSFFVLGDNRDNSMDSRVISDFGYMPAQSVVGRAILIWWAKDWGRIGITPE